MADVKNPSLRELLAAPVKLPVGDIVLEIRPMSWDQGSRAIEHLLPAMGLLPLLSEGEEPGDRMAQWAGVIVTFRDEIAAFTAEASGLPIDDIRALPPTPMLELVVGLVEMNLDFFVQSLPGAAKRVAGRLMAMTQRLEPLLAAVADAPASSASTTSSSV